MSSREESADAAPAHDPAPAPSASTEIAADIAAAIFDAVARTTSRPYAAVHALSSTDTLVIHSDGSIDTELAPQAAPRVRALLASQREISCLLVDQRTRHITLMEMSKGLTIVRDGSDGK